MLYFYKDGTKQSLQFDSSNRLIPAMGCTYTYNAENTRIKSSYNGVETTYTYNTVAKLSQLLVKKTGTKFTKYVYGLGLIGEECNGTYKTYHFDYRGSTVALTNTNGVVTNRFAYDTYGKLTEGNIGITPFLYNGRDGVITDENGLYYMRARYYSPDLMRFVNADIVRGAITDSTSLNRYAYVNGNPVSSVDPFGLCREDMTNHIDVFDLDYYSNPFGSSFPFDEVQNYKLYKKNKDIIDAYFGESTKYKTVYREDLNGIGLIDDYTIVYGNNVTKRDISTLSFISETANHGRTADETLYYVNKYVDNMAGNTVIKRDKLLDYYTNFEDITAYLTNYIIRNEYMYSGIHDDNGWSSYSTNNFLWFSESSSIALLHDFYSKVKNNSQWDLKQYDRWQNSSLYYFNGEIVDSDAPGNIMYGYMGKSYGISDAVLYAGAGFAQILAGTSEPNWIFSSFGDDPIDKSNIARGIELYNNLH